VVPQERNFVADQAKKFPWDHPEKQSKTTEALDVKLRLSSPALRLLLRAPRLHRHNTLLLVGRAVLPPSVLWFELIAIDSSSLRPYERSAYTALLSDTS
jgi:hypothetical protein